MKKLHQILLLAMSFAAWSVGVAAQERNVEIVKDGRVVFAIPASEIECMTVVDFAPEYVDLGLPSGLKWATCNVGASYPSDYGIYYAWGETQPKAEYTDSNSATYYKSFADISGNPKYDVARAHWGGSWRLPTKGEWEELSDLCTWTWTSQDCNNGYKVTGLNGNSIFLPAAGFRLGSSLNGAEDFGYYWSSTPNGGYTPAAYGLYFYSGHRTVYWNSRHYGRAVRPVTDEQDDVTNLEVPKNVCGTAVDGKIIVTWNAVNGATSYKVFRSTDGNSFSQLGTSPSNSFTDNAPLSGSNYYRVQALGANDAQSEPSTATQPITIYNGHAYVDLGLPSGIKWATCNVGASSPSDYGDYFAWGETTTKSTYTTSNSVTDYKSFADISGKPEYDAACANWGGSWRLPTDTECKELLNKCTWRWTSQDSHNGYKVTGPNGKSIFLPAAGCRDGSSLLVAESDGDYWGSTPDESWTLDACNLNFNSRYRSVAWSRRYRGQAVRPVFD